ncbi:BofC C-terminal domain-containing protein [Paenibacillus tuaregi]|uniref:BofC C-terminal domain-containing protein n=1 Tax=Paenibacillus tuaregi TaxID=1816681 RepID=UPI0008382843|nr:BofC C-terminal domain-containing protein [Paenibacillus tuaregi]
MSIFRIKRIFKRRWKRWRRAIWTVSACCLVACLAWLGMLLSDKLEQAMTREEPAALATLGNLSTISMETTSPDFERALTEMKGSRTVHLNKIYTCGEESQILGRMESAEIIDLLNKHPEWKGRVDAEGTVWLDHHIDDLSDICKRSGYIGLDRNGNLSLFEGPPKEEKVMRTFFQMDIEFMESALPEDVIRQVKQGIRIQDVEEYNSVLSTFSDYAVEASQKVMQQNKH